MSENKVSMSSISLILGMNIISFAFRNGDTNSYPSSFSREEFEALTNNLLSYKPPITLPS